MTSNVWRFFQFLFSWPASILASLENLYNPLFDFNKVYWLCVRVLWVMFLMTGSARGVYGDIVLQENRTDCNSSRPTIVCHCLSEKIQWIFTLRNGSAVATARPLRGSLAGFPVGCCSRNGSFFYYYLVIMRMCSRSVCLLIDYDLSVYYIYYLLLAL